jgi:hypothetical protein
MNEREFYDYIQENFNVGGTASRLIENILEYIKAEEFVDPDDAQCALMSLLDGAFGIEEHEIKLYRAELCERCLEYVTHPKTIGETTVCSDCEAHWDISDCDHCEEPCLLKGKPKEQGILHEDGNSYDCCLYDTPRTFEWCEEHCPKYSSCDTVCWALDEEKERNGE